MLHTLSFRGHTFVRDLLDKTSTVIDLGGNLGDFSKAVSETFGCRSYVVEPNPALWEQIPANTLITKFNRAVSSASQPLTFYVSSDIEAGSLKKSSSTLEQIVIQGISLQDILSENEIVHVDLLKVDIEGAECELFDTISDSTLSRIDQITVEFHDFIPSIMSKKDVARIKTRLQHGGFYCISWKLQNNLDVLFLKKTRVLFTDYLFIKYGIRYWSKITSRLNH